MKQVNYKGFIIWYDTSQVEYCWRIRDCAFKSLREAKESINIILESSK